MKIIESLQELFCGDCHQTQEPSVIVIEIPPLMRRGEYADVIAIRHPLDVFMRYTNVPWVMGANMDEALGYEWGYSGCGPTDFALNILLHFTNYDKALANDNVIDFRDKFVRTLPKEGGRIKKEDIFNFIDEMKAKNNGKLLDELSLDQKEEVAIDK